MTEQPSKLPPVIHLPDLTPRPKRTRSGSEKRRRSYVERFRTDEAEHAALWAQVRASGKSLGAYVMRLAKIGATKEARQRRRSHPDPTVNTAALFSALTAFIRVANNLNQIARALNAIALAVEQQRLGGDELVAAVQELRRPVELLQPQFDEPLAAIRAALWPADREE